ncbi:MAG: ornithine carbamoyltransferase [Nitrospiraceae bacterium]|nr:ornithine carbamoyltransferase [Nitrospiraceae bacterium]
MKRDFIELLDITPEELHELINRAIALKKGVDRNKCPLIGKSVGLFFEKASTRTRVSFESALYQLGANSIFLSPGEIQLGRGETVADTARTLSLYLDGMIIRTFGHARLKEFASCSSIPVINALTDTHHPCQALADLMTIYEKKGRLEGVNVAYIGDGNNVANSLMEGAALAGMNISLACPEGFEPDPLVLEKVRETAKGDILVLREPKEAAGRADVIYTDVWVSMGQENGGEERKKRFAGYQINEALLACARKDVIVMHCLPAHRGEEITSGVIDGPNSVVFEQAGNRLHTGKALLEKLLSL